MTTGARKRKSFVRRRLRADFYGFLRSNPLPLAMLAGVGVAFFTYYRIFLNGGWLEGFLDGTFLSILVGMVLLLFLVSGGGVMQLGGSWGETATQEAFKRAAKKGWIWGSVHNVELDGSDIDHVLVAPSGIFAVETKWRFVPLTQDFLSDSAWQAKRAAKKAASVLRSKDVDQSQLVTPLVVIWGKGQDFMPDEGLMQDGVLVIAGSDLRKSWLAKQAKGIVAQDNAEELLERLQTFAETRLVKPVRS